MEGRTARVGRLAPGAGPLPRQQDSAAGGLHRLLTLGHRLALTLVVGYLSLRAHEAGHWLVLRLLGSHQTVMGFSRELRLNAELNRFLDQGLSLTEALQRLPEVYNRAEWVAILAGAFVVQFALIGLGFLLLGRGEREAPKQVGLLLVLFNAARALLYLRYLHGRGTSGDEAMIAYHLGVPEWTVALPLGLAFAVALVAGVRRIRQVPGGVCLGWMTLAGGWGLLAWLPRLDDALWARLQAGSPFPQAVAGVAVPVLAIDALAVLALAALMRRRS